MILFDLKIIITFRKKLGIKIEKNTLMKFICHFLDYLDIFPFPLTMSLNQKESTTTTIGKFFSLIVFIYIVYSFVKSDLLNKTNAQTLGQNYVQTPRPSLYFGKQNFTFAVGVADENNNFDIDESIFHIEAAIYHRNNNDQITQMEVYDMRPCTQADFVEEPEEFIKLGLNGTLCSPFENLHFSGFWDEETIDYFWIELKAFSNSSQNNIVCKSQEEIDNYMSSRFLDVYVTRNSIDAFDYYTPYSRSLHIFYKRLSMQISKTISMYMMQSILETDDGFLLENKNQINSFFLGEIESDFTYKNQSDVSICLLEIYSSDFRNFITRKYQNIQDLLSQIGGLSNFFIFFAFIICKIENQKKTTILISNELFVFQKSLNLKKNSQKETSIQDKAQILSSPRLFFGNAFQSILHKIKNPIPISTSIKSLMSPTRLFKNLDEYQKIKQKENRFVLGFFKFLWLVLFRKKSNLTEDENLFINAQNQIKSELDILKIMKRLQDIEKLKRILLSKEQLYLFNLMSKPMIKEGEILNIRKMKRGNNEFKIQFSEKELTHLGKSELAQMYKEVQTKSQNSEVDSRILKMLDEDVKTFLGTFKK